MGTEIYYIGIGVDTINVEPVSIYFTNNTVLPVHLCWVPINPNPRHTKLRFFVQDIYYGSMFMFMFTIDDREKINRMKMWAFYFPEMMRDPKRVHTNY